ncbi:type II toxin-antitoxin system VapC family toxin [Parasediminibacterium sp. JCM 36343]|uniref:type II toxin-antitoxin system VapC family toxin n=1 Tax=Parasediminibacterium sp. JCM 36343 TaxID=3374279 RepID=UPI00397B5525
MKLLLDTHALIWFMEGNTFLSEKAKNSIENPLNTKFVSIASYYEMTIKLKNR